MINYILGFIIYFGGTLFLANLIIKHDERKQNSIKRSIWLRNWKRSQEQRKIGFLIKLILRKEI